MKPAMIVINYGCPRSGTSFVDNMLEAGTGYFHTKLREFDHLHPVNSDDGLWNLASVFSKRFLLFVRIVRNPIDIFESWYHRKGECIGDKQMYTWIENESVNTALQIERKEK